MAPHPEPGRLTVRRERRSALQSKHLQNSPADHAGATQIVVARSEATWRTAAISRQNNKSHTDVVARALGAAMNVS